MPRFLELLSLGTPSQTNVDDHKRTMWSMNFRSQIADTPDQIEETIAKKIVDDGFGTAINTDIFVGNGVTIPSGGGPLMQIVATGGAEPDETHDGERYERPSIQIVVYASSYQAGRTRAFAIWRSLDGLRNQTLTPS